MDQTILSLELNALHRWCSGDPWGWAELCADDLVYIDPNQAKPILGLNEYKSYLKGFEGQKYPLVSGLIDPNLAVVGDAAVLSYQYCASENGPRIDAGQDFWNVTEVYFRRDAQWKIVHSHRAYVQHRLPERVEIPLPMQLSPRAFEGILGKVMTLESAAMERWRKGDPWGFIEISAPEVTYFDTGTQHRLDGREALSAEYARREGKIFYDVMDFIDPRVQVCGDMAVLAYRFLSTWLNPDGSVANRTPWNCTEVFVRSSDRWQILHTHWSFIKGERIKSV